MEEYIKIKVDALQEFTAKVFNKFGVPAEGCQNSRRYTDNCRPKGHRLPWSPEV